MSIIHTDDRFSVIIRYSPSVSNYISSAWVKFYWILSNIPETLTALNDIARELPVFYGDHFGNWACYRNAESDFLPITVDEVVKSNKIYALSSEDEDMLIYYTRVLPSPSIELESRSVKTIQCGQNCFNTVPGSASTSHLSTSDEDNRNFSIVIFHRFFK